MKSPKYWTLIAVVYSHNSKEVSAMFTMRNVQGHIQVYDMRGNFLFSADTEREARKELEEYAESAA